MTTYIVMLAQPDSVRDAGGLSTEAGRAASREHTQRTADRFRDQGVDVLSVMPNLGGFSAQLTADQLAAVKADPAVLSVSEDAEGHTQ